MSNPTLHEVVDLSYKNPDEQAQQMKKHGYVLDSRFSDTNNQSYWNPEKQKLIFSVSGTHNKNDWITNANLAVGNLKGTKRYQDSDNLLQNAKSHYKPTKTSVIGSSQSGATASYIGKPEDDIYTLNKAVAINQSYRPNEKAYRSENDIISILGKYNSNMTTIKNNSILKDPISSHSFDNFKDLNVFV